MRLWSTLLVLCAAFLACSRSQEGSERLIKATQGALATREAKLSRYHLAARVEAAGQPMVSFDFAYRAPGRMRGRIFHPEEQVVSFDGDLVYEVLPQKHVFRQLRPPQAVAQRALRLSERFAPFVPEGYRTLLLPWRVAKASLVVHPRAHEAVALKAQLKDEAGQPLTVTYTLRWPSGDFLVKRLEGSGGVVELRVDDEQCDRKLGVCLPLRLSQWKDGVKVATTEVTELGLFEAPPAEDFTLRAPAGFTEESAEL